MEASRLLTSVLNLMAEPVVVKPAADGDGVIHYTRAGDGSYKETLHEGPRRRAQRHVFATPPDLARYLSSDRYPAPDRADVLVGDERIVAAPHPGDVRGDLLTCPYRLHPEFALWHKLLEAKVVPQRELLQHVRAAAKTLGEEQASAWLTTLGLLKVVSGGRIESHVDQLGYTRLRGGEQSNEVSTKIAPTMAVHTPLFEGVFDEEGDELHYELEMLVEFDADVLAFGISCPMLPRIRADAVEDLAAMLRRDLGSDFLVLRGEFEQETVADVDRVSTYTLPANPIDESE